MIKKIISLITALLFFAFPLFYIPFPNFATPDQDKQYLLAAITLILLFCYIIHLISKKKSKIVTTSYTLPFVFLSLVYLVSTLLFSANKIETLSLTQSTGSILFFTILYFLITQFSFSLFPLFLSSGILGIFFLIQNSQLLPQLKLPFDYLTSLTFFLPLSILVLSDIIVHLRSLKKRKADFFLISRLLIALSVIPSALVSLYYILKSQPFPTLPFQFGWEIMLDVYKNILSFILGSGPANFPYVFTMLKPALINSSAYWNIIPSQSSNFLLTLATEAGFLAFFIFLVIIGKIIRQTETNSNYFLPSLAVILLLMVIFPANISLSFLFFVILASYATKTETAEINIFRFKPANYLLIAVLIVIGFSFFWQTKFFLSDLMFKNALVAANDNKLDKSFGSLNSALQLNPYTEKNYLLASSLNQMIAANLAKENLSTDSAKQKIYSDTVSASINMSKGAININPNNVKNWEMLLNAYSALPNDNKDKNQLLVDTVSKLLQLDPANPIQKLTAASILISLKQPQQAESLIIQAINLKQDLNSSHYALANLYAQTGNFQNAVPEMQKTLDLTSPQDQNYAKLKDQLGQLTKLAAEATKSAEKATVKK